MRRLMEEETKAKVAALKAAKDAERKAAKEKAMAEKRHAREQREAAKIAKEKAAREAAELAARIKEEEEAAMRARLKYEQEEAERRILEENRRLTAIYEGVKARIEQEKSNLREQLEREKRMQFLEPIEADAMLKLRKKEQQRIRQMRATQEVALRELITAHYQDMERQQQQAILDMEQIADMCDFDIFDDSPVQDFTPPVQREQETPAPREQSATISLQKQDAPQREQSAPISLRKQDVSEEAARQERDQDAPTTGSSVVPSPTIDLADAGEQQGDVPELSDFEDDVTSAAEQQSDASAEDFDAIAQDKPRLSTEIEFESDEDIPEMDTSLTTRNEKGENAFVLKLQEEENQSDEDEIDPTAARSELSSYTPQNYEPADAEQEEDEDDVDISFTGFDAPIDATAKYSVNYGGAAQSAGQGHLVRPSAVMGVKPQVKQLDEDWDFDNTEELQRKEAERERVEVAPLEIKGKTVQPNAGKGKKSAPAPSMGFTVYKPRNTVSATSTAIDDILNNTNMVGHIDEDDDNGKKKKKDKKKK
jgi:hypothetical protein